MTVGKIENKKRLKGLLREYELEDSYQDIVLAHMKRNKWNFNMLKHALETRWGYTGVSKKKLVIKIAKIEVNTYFKINNLIFESEMYAVQMTPVVELAIDGIK